MDEQSIGALKINKSYPHPLSKVVLMPCATQPVAFFLQQYSKAILFDYWRVLKNGKDSIVWYLLLLFTVSFAFIQAVFAFSFRKHSPICSFKKQAKTA